MHFIVQLAVGKRSKVNINALPIRSRPNGYNTRMLATHGIEWNLRSHIYTYTHDVYIIDYSLDHAFLLIIWLGYAIAPTLLGRHVSHL